MLCLIIILKYNDVKRYLSKLDDSKSTGYDKGHPYVLKNANEGLSGLLTI